jgi:DNA polymerase-3 subunit epsilon
VNVYLFSDTETSGFIRKDLPADHPEQCRLVELGAILCDEAGVERSTLSLIIRPEGWSISPGAAAVHGITQATAKRFGIPVEYAIRLFQELMTNCTKCLAFNMNFDRDVVAIERLRMGEERPVPWPVPLECVMELAKVALSLPPTEKMKRAGRFGAKNPNLNEAHVKLFDEPIMGAHSALADARAAKRVWFKCKGMGEPGRDDRFAISGHR